VQGRRHGDSGDNDRDMAVGRIVSNVGRFSNGTKPRALGRILAAVAVVAVSPQLALWLYALAVRIRGRLQW